jgi:hypothetical protein
MQKTGAAGEQNLERRNFNASRVNGRARFQRRRRDIFVKTHQNGKSPPGAAYSLSPEDGRS